MLRWRLSLGVLLIAVLVGLCWWDDCAATPGVVLLPLAIVLSVAAAGELLSLLSAHGNTPVASATYLGVVATVGGAGISVVLPEVAADCPMGPWGGPLVGMMAGVLAVLLVEMCHYEMRSYDKPGKATARLALAVLTIVYAGLLMSFLIQLRLLNGDAESAGGRWGMVAMLSLVAVVKMGDIGAYTVGRLIGRHKMTPRLSPGKTWEGLAGGLVFACLGSCAIFGWLVPWIGLEAITGETTSWIVYGLVVGLAGISGDLSVSLLKRDAGRKDSSRWMPGFGGVLDLLDSILIAAPVAYVLWVTGMVGP